jgi:hypothetical protein
MSKKKTDPQEEEQQLESPVTVIEDNTQTVILTAATNEELAGKFIELHKENEGKTLSTGAVGRNREDGTYTLRVDIID